ncbi:MAG: leucine-rich repeat domain-containing protein [Muribaculaceae bacterium]|nr:leucine-rich repeat domain-containing protein [Muribaculaceae bacterium]
MTTRLATLLIALMLPAALAARALSVSVGVPGTLASLVEQPEAVTALTATGTLDAADFHFMAREMPALATLDISAATIAAYDGEAIAGTRIYPAATLPAMILAGSQLQQIRLPRTLAAIGDGALAGTQLRELTVPASVAAIGSGAFAGCAALQSAALGGATLGHGAFAGCTALRTAATAAQAVPDRCFAGCTALTGLDGAAGLTAIGERAFERCTALRAFAFGPRLRSIGPLAFAGAGLEAASLEGCNALAEVGAGAFAGCTALRALSLPDGADAQRAVAMGCTALTDVRLPEGPVPAYALAGAAEADATAALAAATELGDYALQGVSAAAYVRLPASLEALGHGAMEGMTGMRELDASALDAVPQLGQDVWRGVEQSDVQLTAAPTMIDAFEAAAQWQDFRISDTSGIDTPDADAPAGRIRAYFEGKTLIVELQGAAEAAVRGIQLYDSAGHTLARTNLTPDGRAAVDTARWDENIYIVCALGHDARVHATIKIARNG